MDIKQYKLRLHQAFWGPIDMKCSGTDHLEINISQNALDIELTLADFDRKRFDHRPGTLKRTLPVPNDSPFKKINFTSFYLTQILYSDHETGEELPIIMTLRLNQLGFEKIKEVIPHLYQKWKLILETKFSPPQPFSDTILLVISPTFVERKTGSELRFHDWRSHSKKVMADIEKKFKTVLKMWQNLPDEDIENLCEHISFKEFKSIHEKFGLDVVKNQFVYDTEKQSISSKDLSMEMEKRDCPSEDSTDDELESSPNLDFQELEMIEAEVIRQFKNDKIAIDKEKMVGIREETYSHSTSPPPTKTMKNF